MTVLLAEAGPLDHVVQWIYWDTGQGMWSPFLISNQVIVQIIAALLLVLLIPRYAFVRRTGDTIEDLTPPRGLSHLFEYACNYLRDQVVRPALGPYTDRFVPYVWSVFFYVLFCNLIGLLPLEPITRPIVKSIWTNAHHGIGGSPTGNIWVTGTLAFCTLVMIVVNGIRLNGLAYFAHFCPGPLWLAPLLIPVEIVGLVAKIFALCVRLFANMVAGHVLLAILLGFIFTVGAASVAGGLVVGAIVVASSVAFYFLEIFVAFLQAFIFTFLTALFIGQAVVLHHGAEEHEHKEHAHA